MASDSDLLQGSLFGDSSGPVYEEKKPSSIENIPNHELNDNQLVKDAVTRPRKHKGIEPGNNSQKNVFQDQSKRSKDPNKELPNWSHHNLINPDKITPMLRHYIEVKKKNPDRILLYRLGDFFECFFEDALTVSRLLEITLTSKEAGKEIGKVPMAGIPHHAAERYCSELVGRGLSVSLCDQLESSPSKGGLIKRDITRVLTPGTIIEEGMLEARKNNWLAAILIEKSEDQSFNWGLASADVSTGEFLITEHKGKESLQQELAKLQPSEIIWEGSSKIDCLKIFPDKSHIHEISKTYFSEHEAEASIKRHYKINRIDGLGIRANSLLSKSAGGLISYLYTTKPINIENENNKNLKPIPLDFPKIVYQGQGLLLDTQTRRNLELTSTQRDNKFQGSLLWAIDRTLTSMGGRCLRRWVEEPLIDINAIQSRQTIVSKLVKHRSLRKDLRKILRSMGDLERLAGRAGAGQAGARDIVAIADGIERLPYLAEKINLIKDDGPPWLQELSKVDNKLIDLSLNIRHQIIDTPPLSLTEGGLIHDGVDKLLDGLRNLLDDQDSWLKNQEIEEKEISGIPNLKIQYHRTFGYFLAVSKAKAKQVPEHWIRRQTLANEERFITPALKEREGQIFQSKARAAQKEYEIFCKLRELIGDSANLIRKAARAVAGLDALCSLADVAATNNYCAPKLINKTANKSSRKIQIKDCRHPVVEQLLADSNFEPNDINLGEEIDLIILTGPNASGKSCYLRQIGLIQLLTQIGSWIPASKAEISITDRIFTRVGAVDDLATGQSTFMVEMTETAYILNQATNKSLVLLDEIGRGTATFDGLSIAWAVSEFLSQEIQSRTVFATHYHELNALAIKSKNVANFQVMVEETGESLLFLHKVVPGGASRSYGIEAARLAGVPKKVISKAQNILTKLEAQNMSNEIVDKKNPTKMSDLLSLHQLKKAQSI